MKKEVVIIGGGPAGLAAAIEAARYGAQVLVIDENSRPGGQLLKQIHKFFGSQAHGAGIRGIDIGRKLLEETEECGAEVWLNCAVIGLFSDKRVAVLKDGVTVVVEAEKILISTGGAENPLRFKGWTLPGVMEYVNEIVPYVRDRASVIVGASRERPEDVIELVKNIKASGADAAMVLPSFYCHPSQDEIVEHYRYIMEETDFPIVAYNNPGSAGIEIERDTFKEIFKLKNTAVVKESSGTIQKLTEVLIDAPENVSVFCGCDTLAFESFVDGACRYTV